MESIKTNISHGSVFGIKANFPSLPHSRFSIYFLIFKSQKAAKLPQGSKGKQGWGKEDKDQQASKDDSFLMYQPQKAEITIGQVVRLLAECHQLPESQPHYLTQATKPSKAMFLLCLFVDKREMGKQTKWSANCSTEMNTTSCFSRELHSFSQLGTTQRPNFLRGFSLRLMLVEEREFGSRVQDVGSVADSLCTASETLDQMTISEPQLPQV